MEENFSAFFGVHFLQEALADKRRHPGAYDRKNNFGFLAILLTYFSVVSLKNLFCAQKAVFCHAGP